MIRWVKQEDGPGYAMDREPLTPPSPWPVWARILSKRRNPGERGLGDTTERIIGAFGGDHFKFWFKLVAGHDCGCDSRRDWLNARYPYEQTHAPSQADA